MAAPSDAPARDQLGGALARAGRYAEAAVQFQAAAEASPNDPAPHYRWARALFDSGDIDRARVVAANAARLAPAHPAILGLQADIAQAQRDWSVLATVAGEWTRRHPGDGDAWRAAATAQWQQGMLVEAMASFRACLDRGSPRAEDLATYARLCLTAQANAAAGEALDTAERLDPANPAVLSAQASLATFRGDFDAAEAYARRALATHPVDATAWKVLVQVTRGRLDPGDKAKLALLVEGNALGIDARISALFALADCHDAEGNIAAAFATYAAANAASRERAVVEGLGYDPAARHGVVDALLRACGSGVSPASPASPPVLPAGDGTAEPAPVFIVGLPRSGTTLVEGILAAHSRVVACGERQAMRAIMQEFTASVDYRGLIGLPRATARRWREAWWKGVRPAGTDCYAVTDKNPWNFDAVAVVFRVFPNARVVHVRRNPIETALSIYRSEFPKFASFSCDLEDIAHYIGEYERLMAHWERTLPGRVLTVRYEALATNPTAVVPDLLRHCGLEWEDGCLSPEARKGDINTISAVQARAPIAAPAGRRHAYAAHLGHLHAALRKAGISPDGDDRAT